MKRNIACSLALLAALNTGMAYADTRICRGSIGSEHIDGDVRVPAGARCKLNGTRVDGNIKLQARASLQARQVQVDGNVEGENHAHASIAGGSVGGNIQLKQAAFHASNVELAF